MIWAHAILQKFREFKEIKLNMTFNITNVTSKNFLDLPYASNEEGSLPYRSQVHDVYHQVFRRLEFDSTVLYLNSTFSSTCECFLDLILLGLIFFRFQQLKTLNLSKKI